MSLYARLAAALAVALLIAGYSWKLHHSGVVDGRAEVQAKWDAERIEQRDAALRVHEAKAREGLRRLEQQQENQRVQNLELAAARAAADRNRADADRVREQAAGAARDWAERLADSPTRADLQAAGAAISVCTDLRGRADRRAGILASYADAARAAGLKCERDYDSLAPVGLQPPR